MHAKATITNIDLSPEFGDITGTEATITISLFSPSRNAWVLKTLDVTKAEASAYSLGQEIPLLSF